MGMRQFLRKIRGWNRWSHSVADYYPLNARPRWGSGLPANPYVTAALERGRPNYEKVLAGLLEAKSRLHTVAFEPAADGSPAPFWNNHWFTGLDACSLMGFLWSRRPARYMEIGSGHSTQFARHAVRIGDLATTITSIDPHPRASIDLLCDTSIRQGLEACDLSVFDVLDAGDILFFDGSHRMFTNSDVTVFFCEVMPRLKPGVLVHIHDIFLPDDYPLDWSDRLYSEQYALAVMLLCPQPPFEVVLPNYFVASDPDLQRLLLQVLRGAPGDEDIPLRYSSSLSNTYPASFWLEIKK
jgi:hypothetical protein